MKIHGIENVVTHASGIHFIACHYKQNIPLPIYQSMEAAPNECQSRIKS